LTIANLFPIALEGPLVLILDLLAPGVKLDNQLGTTAPFPGVEPGVPIIQVPDGAVPILYQGQRITVTLMFHGHTPKFLPSLFIARLAP
jgi:hypothetical protein